MTYFHDYLAPIERAHVEVSERARSLESYVADYLRQEEFYVELSKRLSVELGFYENSMFTLENNDDEARFYILEHEAFKRVLRVVEEFRVRRVWTIEFNTRYEALIKSYESFGELLKNITPLVTKAFDSANALRQEWHESEKTIYKGDDIRIIKELISALIESSNFLAEGKTTEGLELVAFTIEYFNEHVSEFGSMIIESFNRLESELLFQELGYQTNNESDTR